MARASNKTITGRRERQQNRRLEAARLFSEGRTRAAVAVSLGVTWRAAHEWFKAWKEGGANSLKATAKPGPVPRLSAENLDTLRDELLKGAVAHGYRNELWTLRRVRRLVLDLFDVKVSQTGVWRLLRGLKWSPQKPLRKARERDEGKIRKWKEEGWPAIKQKAQEEARTIVFVDECGFSQKSTAKKTWAPEGQTPVLEMNFNWDKLSVIGGISLKSIYFQIHEESIKSKQVVTFLDQLRRHVKGRLLVVWDGLPAHRSKQVAEYLASTKGEVWVERLPAYAPELNPIEYLWGNIKGNDLANVSPKELWELSKQVRDAIFRKKRRPKLIQAFWVQTELNLDGLN